MKRFLFIFSIFFSLVSYANAQHIGPGTPIENVPGKTASINVGIGYNYVQSEWDADDYFSGDVEFEQNQAYLHLGAVFGDAVTPKYEVFARVGIADFEDDEDGDFDADAEAMFAVGLRSEFYQGETFGIGAVLQGAYIDSFDDNDVNIENIYEIEFAVPLQAKVGEQVLFYLGPIVYRSTADLEVDYPGGGEVDTDFDENNNVGGFGGVAWRTGQWSLEAEVKYRSDISAGGFVSFAF